MSLSSDLGLISVTPLLTLILEADQTVGAEIDVSFRSWSRKSARPTEVAEKWEARTDLVSGRDRSHQRLGL